MGWFEQEELVEPHSSNEELNTYVFQNIMRFSQISLQESNLP